MANSPVDHSREEAYEILSDVPDPMGTGQRGMMSSIDFTKTAFAHPEIRYKGRHGDFLLTGDLYKAGEHWMLQIYCPVCSTPEAPHMLTIKSERKKIEFDANKGVSVEPFGCTWELPELVGSRREFGAGLCRFRVAIENNRAYDV